MPPTAACVAGDFVWRARKWARKLQKRARTNGEALFPLRRSPLTLPYKIANCAKSLLLLECGLPFLHGHPIHSKVFLLQGRGSTCRCGINLHNFSRLHWNVGLGKGWVGSFLGTYDDPCFPLELKCDVLSHNTLLKKRKLRPWRLGMDKE